MIPIANFGAPPELRSRAGGAAAIWASPAPAAWRRAGSSAAAAHGTAAAAGRATHKRFRQRVCGHVLPPGTAPHLSACADRIRTSTGKMCNPTCAGVVALTTNMLAEASALRRSHCVMRRSHTSAVTAWWGCVRGGKKDYSSSNGDCSSCVRWPTSKWTSCHSDMQAHSSRFLGTLPLACLTLCQMRWAIWTNPNPDVHTRSLSIFMSTMQRSWSPWHTCFFSFFLYVFYSSPILMTAR